MGICHPAGDLAVASDVPGIPRRKDPPTPQATLAARLGRAKVTDAVEGSGDRVVWRPGLP